MPLNVIAPLFYIITDTSLHLICSLYIFAVILTINVIQLISFSVEQRESLSTVHTVSVPVQGPQPSEESNPTQSAKPLVEPSAMK